MIISQEFRPIILKNPQFIADFQPVQLYIKNQEKSNINLETIRK